MNWDIAPQFAVPQVTKSVEKVSPVNTANALDTTPQRAAMRKDETAECVALNSYLMMLEKHCDFAFTFSGNGGLRNYVVAAVLKACGLRAGVWDYYFRAPGRPTHWLEMKFGKNGLSTPQEKWRDALEPMGDTFSVAWSAEEALKQLVEHEIIPAGMVFFGPTAVHIRLVPPAYT